MPREILFLAGMFASTEKNILQKLTDWRILIHISGNVFSQQREKHN